MFDQQQSTQENVMISRTVDLIGCRTPLLHIWMLGTRQHRKDQGVSMLMQEPECLFPSRPTEDWRLQSVLLCRWYSFYSQKEWSMFCLSGSAKISWKNILDVREKKGRFNDNPTLQAFVYNYFRLARTMRDVTTFPTNESDWLSKVNKVQNIFVKRGGGRRRGI